jgi:hypothetical protein
MIMIFDFLDVILREQQEHHLALMATNNTTKTKVKLLRGYLTNDTTFLHKLEYSIV